MNAVKRVYLGITCEGDSFHFVQAVMKQLRKLGLMDDYDADDDLNHQVSCRCWQQLLTALINRLALGLRCASCSRQCSFPSAMWRSTGTMS
jgi:hypothetical protein